MPENSFFQDVFMLRLFSTVKINVTKLIIIQKKNAKITVKQS